MPNLLVILYNSIPARLRHYLGRQSVLQNIRNLLLRTKGTYREVRVLVNKMYGTHTAEFVFFASIQVAAVAKQRGIESKLIHNTLQLLKDYPERPNDFTIFDIGANFGFLSLVWAKSVCKNGAIVAFEPNREVYRSFEKSVIFNNLESQIRLENLAVGNDNGTVQLHISTTSSNLMTQKKTGRSYSIPMVTLDSYIIANRMDKCDVIKIDVDGIEHDILEGAKASILKYKPIVIVETNENREIITYFEDLNYEILDMDLNFYNKSNPLPPNIFAVPKKRL